MNNTGFSKPGIRQWISAHPGLKQSDRQRIIADNESAVERVRSLRLPMDRDFGSFDTLTEASAAVPDEYKARSLFIIRCPHRTKDIIQRKLFVPWSEVVRFVESLPEGAGHYRLGIREVTPAAFSGTIISSGGGSDILIEMWPGKHFEMDQGSKDTSLRGEYSDDPTAPLHFVWSERCTDRIKRLMLGALWYFVPKYPHLRPDKSFFAEFSVTDEGFYRFHGVSFDPFWTERPNPTRFPSWGD